MAAGKESYSTLREMYRISDFRRFRARHRNNKWADLLGISPDGKSVLGFWDGSEEPTKFPPDDIQWCQLITYV